MTQLKFRNMRNSGCNSPNLVQNPTGTWVNFPWPIPILFNQCLFFFFASKLFKYRFYTLKMQDITFKEVLNAYWHFKKNHYKKGRGLHFPLKYRYFVNKIVHFIKYVKRKRQKVLISRNYHILVNNYDFMNQEGWYSLMRGVLFQTGMDTLYVTLITENFDTKIVQRQNIWVSLN